jgi:uncharacterized membrane protein
LEREEGNPENAIGRLAARLPKADGELLWQTYREKETPILGAIAAAKAARARAFSVIAQPKLDAAALQAALKEAMDDGARARQLMAETLLEALQRMSPEARLQITRQYQQ